MKPVTFHGHVGIPNALSATRYTANESVGKLGLSRCAFIAELYHNKRAAFTELLSGSLGSK